MTDDTQDRWTLRHVSGSNVHVQEFEIRGMFGDKPCVTPIFNLSNFGVKGTTIHVSPRHARLIAAAPELLAMVRRYASECANCVGCGLPETCADCAHIRRLIAKAEGRS